MAGIAGDVWQGGNDSLPDNIRSIAKRKSAGMVSLLHHDRRHS